jgi:hypothetical protein
VQALYQYFDVRGRIWEGRALLNHALENLKNLRDDVASNDCILIKALLLNSGSIAAGEFCDWLVMATTLPSARLSA